MPSTMLADTYGYKIKHSNQGVHEDLVCYIGICDRTPTLEQHMEHQTALDMSLNKSQPGCGSSANSTTTTKVSVSTMDFMKGSTPGTAGMDKADCISCHNCGQVGHITHNCQNWNLMKKLLKQALVGKHAPEVQSGDPLNNENKGNALTSRKESGWHAKVKQAKQVTHSEVGSKLESLQDLESEAGKGKGGQKLHLYLLSKHHLVQYCQNWVENCCQIVNSSFSPITTSWRLVN